MNKKEKVALMLIIAILFIELHRSYFHKKKETNED